MPVGQGSRLFRNILPMLLVFKADTDGAELPVLWTERNAEAQSALACQLAVLIFLKVKQGSAHDTAKIVC